MFNVRLAGGHLYGKQLFTWLSLVVSLMACFVLSFFPLDVLDAIWDIIESVSEGFLSYSFMSVAKVSFRKFHMKMTTRISPLFKRVSNLSTTAPWKWIGLNSMLFMFKCYIPLKYVFCEKGLVLGS